MHGDCHVQFEKRRYSAPYRWVHQALWLRATDTTVRLYRAQEMVAIHPRLSRPGARSTLDEPLPPEALAFDTPRYRSVKTILDNGLDQQPLDEPAFDALSEAYTGAGRFGRNTRKLLTH